MDQALTRRSSGIPACHARRAPTAADVQKRLTSRQLRHHGAARIVAHPAPGGDLVDRAQASRTNPRLGMHDTDLDARAFDLVAFPDRLVTACPCRSSARLDMPEPVQRPLQDIARRDRVDHLCATFSCRIRLQQCFFRRNGAETLVPERDRDARRTPAVLREVPGESAGGLRTRALAAVHVARQAQDRGPQDRRFARCQNRSERVLRELGPA
jgi:hypothetical protein